MRLSAIVESLGPKVTYGDLVKSFNEQNISYQFINLDLNTLSSNIGEPDAGKRKTKIRFLIHNNHAYPFRNLKDMKEQLLKISSDRVENVEVVEKLEMKPGDKLICA